MSRIVQRGCIFAWISVTLLFMSSAWGQPVSETAADPPFSDELQRETPRSTVEGFLVAARDRDYARAAKYLDLSSLPQSARAKHGPEFAQQLYIVFERALWSNLDVLSDAPEGRKDDELPDFQELVGKINFEDQTFDIVLHRAATGDIGFLWQFSAATVAELPEIYERIGYGVLGEFASRISPDIEILGAPIWQITTLVMVVILAYLMALGIIGLLRRFIRQGTAEQRERRQKYLTGPFRFF